MLEELRIVLPETYTTDVENCGRHQVEIPYAVRVGGQHKIRIRTETWGSDGSRDDAENENSNDRDLRDSERTTQFSVPTLETNGSSIIIRTLKQTLVLENEAIPTFPTELVTTTCERDSFALLNTTGVEVNPENQGTGAFPVLIVSDRKHIVPFFEIAFSNQTRIVILSKK